MVVTAFLNQLSRGIAEGIGNLFSDAGIGGRSNTGDDNGAGGNIFTNIITRVLDPEGSNGSGGGLDIKNIILDNLTEDNLNTFKDLLRGYWGNHKEEVEEVRKDLDIIREKLGNEGMAGKLARTIECIENEISDEDCNLGMRSGIDSLPEYVDYDRNDNVVRIVNDATTRVMEETSKIMENNNMAEGNSADSFAIDARVITL